MKSNRNNPWSMKRSGPLVVVVALLALVTFPYNSRLNAESALEQDFRSNVYVSDDLAFAPPNPEHWHHPGCDSVSVINGDSGSVIYRPLGRISPGQLATNTDGSLVVSLSSNTSLFLLVVYYDATSNNWNSLVIPSPSERTGISWQLGGPVAITEDNTRVIVATTTGFQVFDLLDLRSGVLTLEGSWESRAGTIGPADFELMSDGTSMLVVSSKGFVHVVDLVSLIEVGDPIGYIPTHGTIENRVRRTYSTLSTDNHFLVINGGSASPGQINVVDLWSRASQLVNIPGVHETWDLEFNWAAGLDGLLAINGRDRLMVTRFKGVITPEVVSTVALPTVVDIDYRTNPGVEFWRPGAIAWDTDGTRLYSSRGGPGSDTEWRAFDTHAASSRLIQRFDFDSCTWVGRNPSVRDHPEMEGVHTAPLDIVTLNGRHRPTLTPTPAPTPTSSDTATAPPSVPSSPQATTTSTPTPRPSATITPTAPPTPTQVPAPIFLPLALREHCVPGAAPVDAVLVVDASVSMSGAKLDAAKAAALAFIDALTPGSDRVALVAFNETATLLHPLAGDPAALRAAVADIAPAPGTRVDRGLDAALGHLRSARRTVPALAVLILLTDGIQTVDADRPAVLADGARADGIDVWVVGLGSDVDAAYLRRIAGEGDDADRYVPAPSAEDLVSVYRDIAKLVPCPAGAYWGRR